MDSVLQHRLLSQDSEDQDAETEESDDEQKETIDDPGSFRYNKRISIAAVPCLCLIFSIVGEILLCVITISAVVVFLLDYLEEKRRCVIVYVSVFFACHILVIYSVFPLIWLSWVNIVLLIIINFFFILTGGWGILQFSAFRREEYDLIQVIEKTLFTAYPVMCLALLLWASVSVVKVSLVPYLAISFGFILLQLFLAPTVSSFKLKPNFDGSLNIIDPLLIGLMCAIFWITPICLEVILAVTVRGKDFTLSNNFLIELSFITFVTLFLTTFLPLRQFTEHIGVSYQAVVRARWLGGTMATVLCYPFLDSYGLTSHYLTWLPSGIGAHVWFGLCLSHKKFKNLSLICLLLLLALHSFWISRVPWGLKFILASSLHINAVYLMIWLNSALCLACAFMANHSDVQWLGLLACLQAIVFSVSEAMLYTARLYSLSMVVVSGSVALYVLYRLTVVGKLPFLLSLISTSIHTTKMVIMALVVSPYLQEIGPMNLFTVFLLVLHSLRAFVYDSKLKLSPNKVRFHMLGSSLLLGLNVHPVISTLSPYLLNDYPSLSDLTGVWLMLSGLAILVLSTVHISDSSFFSRLGPMIISIGALVICIQPDWSWSWSSVAEWGNIISILVTATVFLAAWIPSFNSIISISFLITICPGYSLSQQFYAIEGSAFTCISYTLNLASLLTFVIYIVKTKSSNSFERKILHIYIFIAITGVLVMLTDFLTQVPPPSKVRACWHILVIASITVSICLKFITYKIKDLQLSLSEEKEKTFPLLPILGNVATVMSFFLICTISPAPGFLQDIWYCGASIALICLQRDQKIFTQLSSRNQAVPTIMAAILTLVFLSIMRSDLWLLGAPLSTMLRGFLEVSAITVTLPIYLVLCGILWLDEVITSEKVVVFLMPLNLLLFLCGSTYTSWTLALAGIFSSMWMMSYKLPLEVHVDYR